MNKDEEIKKLKQEVIELTNNWKRALADYQNLEKRVIGQRIDLIKSANAVLITRLLNILDTLEKVEIHLKDKGLELAIAEFKKVLKEEGLEEINVAGKKFNHNEMECVEVIKGDEEENVAEVVFRGYRLNGKLLRPAKVKVYKREIDQKAENLAKEQVTQKGDYM